MDLAADVRAIEDAVDRIRFDESRPQQSEPAFRREIGGLRSRMQGLHRRLDALEAGPTRRPEPDERIAELEGAVRQLAGQLQSLRGEFVRLVRALGG